MQSHTSTIPWINQYIINPKIDLFLKELGHTEKPVTGQGLCNGYSHMLMRADLIGESEQFFERLRKFSAMDDERITKIAHLLKKYQRQYELNEYSLINNIQESKRADDIRELRSAHHKKIKAQTHDKLTAAEKADLQFAEELLIFINNLLFCGSPDDHLGCEDVRVNQEDFLDILKIIPPDKLIPSATFPVKEAFKIGFTFTDEEFIDVLEKMVMEGDRVILRNNLHVIYLKKQNGVYILYDSNHIKEFLIFQSTQELITQIKADFFYDPKKQKPYTSICMLGYDKQDSKQDRPNPVLIIKKILDSRGSKIDINSQGFDGSTALYAASKINDIEIVKELLTRKADPNISNNKGLTPLHIAVAQGHTTIASELLKHGANPNIGELTPLAMALVRRSTSIIKLLVEHKADLNKKLHNVSILERAISTKNNFLTELLINQDLGLTDSQKDGFYLLQIAATFGNQFALAKLIERKVDVNKKTHSGKTVAYLAAAAGHRDALELLIKHRADINIIDENQSSPLMAAAYEGSLSTVELLMQHGAQITADENGLIPISLAAAEGHVAILKYFLKEKPEEFKKSKNLVISAARSSHISVVRFLAENKFSLEESDDGFLPVHIAACYGYVELIDLLAEYKVDLNKPDPYGCTAAFHAVYCGRAEVVAALGKYGVDLNQTFPDGKTTFAQYALDSENLEVLSALAEHGVDISKGDYYRSDKRGWNLLDRAARDNKVELFNLLSKHAVNLDFSHEDGWTPILIAAKYGNPSIVKLLAEYKGIDVNAGNKVNGITAMHRAAEYDNVNVLEALDEVKGVDFNKKNKSGFTPFYNAITYRNEGPTEFFLNRKPEAVISTLLSMPSLSFLSKNFMLKYRKQLAEAFLKIIYKTEDVTKRKEMIDLACSGKNALSLILNHSSLSDDASRLFKKPSTIYNGKPVSATLFEIILKVPGIKLEDCRRQLPRFEF
ncbi:MAG: ankyrin repeat domain-containing protein [Gammaproteobacteria bacterium]